MVSAMPVPGTVTVCSPMALNMSSMMRPARSPLDLAQSFTSSIPARFMPAGPPYRSRSASVASRVARSPFQDAFERGMSSIRARVCRRMKEQGQLFL